MNTQLGYLGWLWERAGRRLDKALCAVHSRSANIGFPLSPSDRRMRALRNIHKGGRAFIIGNGPSLKASDLEQLRSEITFACNKIYLLFDQTSWRPTYYNVEDDLVAKQNAAAIDQVAGMTRFFHNGFEKWLRADEQTIWYRVDDFPIPFPGFSIDPVARCVWGGSVTYINLQLAAYMGITDIYLVGIDFNFKEPNKRSGYYLINANEVNHFSTNYRKPGELWNPPLIDVQLQAMRFCREFCKARGINIYNATRGGCLEVFERVNLDELTSSKWEDRVRLAAND